MNYFESLLFSLPALLIAVTIHEFTRAVASTHFGDVLPKSKGRLTLNPLNHIEPIGLILLFYSGGFGWGKPVETSALYYKDRKRNTLSVAIAPSIANLILGFLFAMLLCFLPNLGSSTVATILYQCAYYNVAIAIYNILPVYPMDGAKVLAQFLPANKYYQYMQYEKIIQMIVIFLVLFGTFSGIFSTIINAILSFVFLLFGSI